MPGDFLEAQLDMDRIKAEEMDDFGKTEAEQMHINFLEARLDMGKIEAEEEDSGVEEEEGSVYVDSGKPLRLELSLVPSALGRLRGWDHG